MTDAEREAEIARLMRLPYHRLVVGEPLEGYLAEILEFPGCFTAGETPVEAAEMLEDAMAAWLMGALMNELLIPAPFPIRGLDRQRSPALSA